MSLQARLEQARRQQFVGRDAEKMLFQTALAAHELPFVALYFFGAGGVGKTSLLRELIYLAQELGATAVYVDGRDIEPSPAAFQEAVRQAAELPVETAVAVGLGRNGRFALFIDTYELLTPLDSWLRDTFLPQLAENVLVVLASRQPPSAAWRSDPGWQMLMRVLPLRNLSHEESQDYLQRRHVPPEQHEAVLSFTHGHALALSLVAEATAQQPNAPFQPDKTPNIIQVLLERLIQQVPTAVHRHSLEACATVRLLTEPLLAALLQIDDAHQLFAWLRGLSFMDFDRRGIFPHDLAREAITADLRWRNREWYNELHNRARAYYMQRVNQGTPNQQRRLLSDYIYLHRDNATVKPFFEWQATGLLFADEMKATDKRVLVAMVAAHEGEQAARLAQHWLAQQPERVRVFRQTAGGVQGFLLALALERVGEDERGLDPAVTAVWRYLQTQPPLRAGETATLFRFWMAKDSYQAVTSVQSHIFLHIVQHYLATPGLAYSFIPCADPDFWVAAFAYADLQRLHKADFVVGQQRYGVYGRDWRTLSPLAWLEFMAQREMGIEPTAQAEVLLAEAPFKAAVHQALRDRGDTAVLQKNALISSRLVTSLAGPNTTPAERAQVLQTLLTETLATFSQTPRQLKWHRALHHTYFQPAPTQEKTAELLQLPFSTYRRHLRQGIEALANRLWEKEITTRLSAVNQPKKS